jgi:hypothetical protein
LFGFSLRVKRRRLRAASFSVRCRHVSTYPSIIALERILVETGAISLVKTLFPGNVTGFSINYRLVILVDIKFGTPMGNDFWEVTQ